MREGRSRQQQTWVAAERLEARQHLSATMRAAPANLGPASPGTVASPAFSAGSNGPFGLSPSQIRAAYGLDNVKFNGVVGDGSGQTIAIVVAYDDPAFVSSTSAGFAASDLHKFDVQFGLADPPSFAKVGQTGSATNLPGIDPTGAWENETALDVEWAHVAAPAANLMLVECNSDGLNDLINPIDGAAGTGGVNYARQQAGVSVVSMSFAADETADELKYDAYLTTPAGHQGVTFVAASGDDGGTAEYPAASPDVVAVGGTTVSLAGDVYSSETALSNGGGGVSQYEPKPSFQAGLTQSATHRLVPDVSFAANHFTNGFDVYDSYNGGADPWYGVGGTSVAAPIWGAIVAMANQGRARIGLATLNGTTSTLLRLYQLGPSNFHDVTTGSNGYAAGAGYDLATGRGTPIANVLVPDLAGGASITGNDFVDANGNGVRDAGDVGLTAALVYLDLAGNGTPGGIDPIVYTGAAGAFSFSDLPGGTYVLTGLPYTSYVPSTTTTYTVTVGYDSTVSGKLFGQRHVTGTISGYMFEDLHLSTIRTADDPPFGFLPVYLDNNDDGVYDAGDVQTFTDVHGYYQFTGLGLGATYHVLQNVPAGLSRTTVAGSSAAPVTLLGTSYTLNIGYVPNTGSISGNVFEDDNGNGVRDGAEPPIYGTAIYLDLDRNGVYTPGLDVYVLTTPSGSYTISGLAPGTYRVNQVIPTGYRRTGGVTTGVDVVVGIQAAVQNVNFADQLL